MEATKEEDGRGREAELEVWRTRRRRRREREEKRREAREEKIRGGGLENTDHGRERPMREGDEGKTEKENEEKRERRESEMGETSRANSNANELLHWQIIRGSHLASRDFFFRDRAARMERNGEILESSPKSSESRSFGIYRGVPDVFREPPYISISSHHEETGSNRSRTLCRPGRAPADS